VILWTVAVTAADGDSRARIASVLRDAGISPLPPSQILPGTGVDAHVVATAGAFRSVMRRRAEHPLVAVVPDRGPHAVRHAVEAGARGVVLDSRVEQALVPTLEAVLAGQLVRPLEVPAGEDRTTLSRREKQVLALVAVGMTNAQIAKRLSLSESTVKGHLTSAFGKLGVHTRNQAAELVLNPEEHLALAIFGIAQDGQLAPAAQAHGQQAR
jgi:DNA-binding CsgD family transcriptional regulator